MNEYEIYFTIYDKKMKVVIAAENEAQAISKLRTRILIHKVNELKKKDLDDFDIYSFLGIKF